MHTPLFPAFRARLAALGRRTVPTLRQATLAQLQQHLRDFLPPPLLAAEEEGPNSRERVFSLRLTFECFLWQLLKPKTSCREVVRQVQALFRLQGGGLVREGDSALPFKPANGCPWNGWKRRWPPRRKRARAAAPARPAPSKAGPSKSSMARPPNWPTRRKTNGAIPNRPRKKPVAAFPS